MFFRTGTDPVPHPYPSPHQRGDEEKFTSHNALHFVRNLLLLCCKKSEKRVDVRNTTTMSNREHRQFLGTWKLKSTKKGGKTLDVYEFRYLWQLRVGVELVDREENNAEIFAVLSTNVPEVPLEPGEFIVKSYSENKDLWLQMKDFPEFEDTGKFALLPFDKCPIWRLRSHDICCHEELKGKGESERYFTGVIEKAFIDLRESRPKRQYKDVITAGRLMDELELVCQALCESDYFSKDTQSLKYNEKRLVKVRGKWTILQNETER